VGGTRSHPHISPSREIVQVHGLAMKDVMHEKFGDGIMSGIDFTMEVARINATGLGVGDRCEITMEGKWLSYRQW
jgi:cyanate lyase